MNPFPFFVRGIEAQLSFTALPPFLLSFLLLINYTRYRSRLGVLLRFGFIVALAVPSDKISVELDVRLVIVNPPVAKSEKLAYFLYFVGPGLTSISSYYESVDPFLFSFYLFHNTAGRSRLLLPLLVSLLFFSRRMGIRLSFGYQ